MEHGVARFCVDCGPVVRYVHTSHFFCPFVVNTVLIGPTFGGHIEQGSSAPHFLYFVPLVNLRVMEIAASACTYYALTYCI
jgi:hypothetical protein